MATELLKVPREPSPSTVSFTCFSSLGSEIKLTIRRDLPMEIDGEPFLLGPCQITITRKNQARMIITERSQAAQQIQSKRV